MKVFLYVTEGQYQGLYGICNQIVTEDINSYEEAQEYATELGWQLIESYDNYVEENENQIEINWVVWQIKDDVSETTRELDKLACKFGKEIFVEKYCKKNPIW